MGAAAVRRLDVGEHERHLQRHARPRIRLEVDIQAPAVLVPAEPSGLRRLIFRRRRRDDEMAVIKLDVPAKDVDDPSRFVRGQSISVRKRFVEPDAIQVVQAFRAVSARTSAGIPRIADRPLPSPRFEGRRRQHAPGDEVPLRVKGPALLVRQPVVQTFGVPCVGSLHAVVGSPKRSASHRNAIRSLRLLHGGDAATSSKRAWRAGTRCSIGACSRNSGDYARFAEARGYFGFGHPEHHLQIEGFEIANDPALMSMWLGQHTETMRIVTCGFVSTANNPLATAEKIATMDHMLGGRLGIGLVRGYQARWVENFKVRPDLKAVGPWTKDTPDDDLNRRYFSEFVEVVTKALANETFSHRGEFLDLPASGFRESASASRLHAVWPGRERRHARRRDRHRAQAPAAGNTALRRLLREPAHGEVLGQVQGPPDRAFRQTRSSCSYSGASGAKRPRPTVTMSRRARKPAGAAS